MLCHRDYHSRNLMLHDDRLYIIDFQDARMGPDTYDLVSLLRDSYVDLPEQTVNELIAYFLALKGTTDPMQETVFRERFDLMALQRNLKALGTFGYQTTARRNPVYIQYIPRTLRYVRDNLGRHPRFPPARLLAAHVEEFRSSRRRRLRATEYERTADVEDISSVPVAPFLLAVPALSRSRWYNRRFARDRKR